MYGIMTEELVIREIRIDEAAGRGDSDSRMTSFEVIMPLRAATNESQKTVNKCETRNKTVFHTRLRHPETINSFPLNSVLRIKQICV